MKYCDGRWVRSGTIVIVERTSFGEEIENYFYDKKHLFMRNDDRIYHDSNNESKHRRYLFNFFLCPSLLIVFIYLLLAWNYIIYC